MYMDIKQVRVVNFLKHGWFSVILLFVVIMMMIFMNFTFGKGKKENNKFYDHET